MPGFTAKRSLYKSRFAYRNTGVYVQASSGTVLPSYFDPTAIFAHGNCCGYTRKCNCGSATIDAVDRACRDHDVCVDSPYKAGRCECHTDFVKKLENASPTGAALKIIAAISTIPCLCTVSFLGKKVSSPSTVGLCRYTPGHISAGVSCPSDWTGPPPPPACNTRADCGPGQWCIFGTCRPSWKRCRSNSDCPDGICVEARNVGTGVDVLGPCGGRTLTYAYPPPPGPGTECVCMQV